MGIMGIQDVIWTQGEGDEADREFASGLFGFKSMAESADDSYYFISKVEPWEFPDKTAMVVVASTFWIKNPDGTRTVWTVDHKKTSGLEVIIGMEGDEDDEPEVHVYNKAITLKYATIWKKYEFNSKCISKESSMAEYLSGVE